MVTGSLVKCERCDGTSWVGPEHDCDVCSAMPYMADPAYFGTPLGTIALPISPEMLAAYPEWVTQWTNPENEENDE